MTLFTDEDVSDILPYTISLQEIRRDLQAGLCNDTRALLTLLDAVAERVEEQAEEIERLEKELRSAQLAAEALDNAT